VEDQKKHPLAQEDPGAIQAVCTLHNQLGSAAISKHHSSYGNCCFWKQSYKQTTALEFSIEGIYCI
jgi:hypothetical protein